MRFLYWIGVSVPRQRRVVSFRLILRVAFVGLLGSLIAIAHEGHKPITSKGVMFGPRSQHLLVEPRAGKSVGLETARVDIATLEDVLRLPAQVVLPPSGLIVATPSVGGTLDAARVKPGDKVRKGDVLGDYSSKDVELLQAELRRRIETKDSATIEALREKLRAIGLSPAALAALEQRGEITPRLSLVAPMDGEIARLGPEGVELIDRASLRLVGELPESHASRVLLGMAVRAAGRSSKVDWVGSELSGLSRTFSVRASISDPGPGLAPGDIVEMVIVLGVSKDAAVVPSESIIREGLETFALVREKTGTYVRVNAAEREEEYSASPALGFVQVDAFERKDVVLGLSDGRRVEIVEGLFPGDEVATRANHVLASLYTPDPSRVSVAARKNLGILTQEVAPRAVDSAARFAATLRLPAEHPTPARSPIEGTILEIHAEPGAAVRKGDVLAKVGGFTLDGLQIDYRANRQPDLRLRLEALGFTPEQLSALLDRGERVLACPVIAPTSGTITLAPARIGHRLSAHERLFEISDSRVLRAEAWVTEEEARRILSGRASKPAVLRHRSHAKREWKGEVRPGASRGPFFSLECDVDNSDGVLRPGMTLELFALIEHPQAPVLAAPVRALFSSGDRVYVFAESEIGFRRARVQVGRRDAAYAQILQGLRAGDRVAVSGLNELGSTITSP